MTDQDNSADTAAAPAASATSPAAPAPAPAVNIQQHKEGVRAILMDDALDVEEAFEKAWHWLVKAVEGDKTAAAPAASTDTAAKVS